MAGLNIRTSLLVVSAGTMLVTLYLIFFWVPTDVNLGIVQRVFYFHVPVAILGMLSFVIVFIGSVLYLWRRAEQWDALGYSAAELGMMLTTLMLVTGAIWAKPVWGVWWQWDARLTTSLILWFIYVTYFMLRAYVPNKLQGARYASVLGVIGALDVAIIYFSVTWWRTVHPPALVGPLAESDSLESSMRVTLLVSLLAFSLLFAYLLGERYSLRRSEDILEEVYQQYG